MRAEGPNSWGTAFSCRRCYVPSAQYASYGRLHCVIRNEAPVESVHRALVLLARIMSGGPLSVTDAAATLKVNASTAYRLLATLVHDGFATQMPDRRYAAGPVLDATAHVDAVAAITKRLRPALETLLERTGETVHLARLVGTRIQHIDGIEASWHPLRFGARVGVWLPAAVTSAGKAMLAARSDEDVRRRYGVQEGEDGSIEELFEQLRGVRQGAAAVNVNESEIGVAALAVSLGVIDDTPLAFSIAVPSPRFSEASAQIWQEDLRAVAEDVARRHGGRV